MWKNIKGYGGIYQVSDEGEVRSLNYRNTGRVQVLKPNKNNCGYLLVTLYKNGKRKSFSVHRLVAEAFLPNPDNLPEINHKDENKANNCASNLEWCDRKYNANFGTGIERSAKNHLKPVKQFDLRGNFIQDFPSIIEVQRKLGYNQSYISAACSGRFNQAYGYRWNYN